MQATCKRWLVKQICIQTKWWFTELRRVSWYVILCLDYEVKSLSPKNQSLSSFSYFMEKNCKYVCLFFLLLSVLNSLASEQSVAWNVISAAEMDTAEFAALFEVVTKWSRKQMEGGKLQLQNLQNFNFVKWDTNKIGLYSKLLIYTKCRVVYDGLYHKWKNLFGNFCASTVIMWGRYTCSLSLGWTIWP